MNNRKCETCLWCLAPKKGGKSNLVQMQANLKTGGMIENLEIEACVCRLNPPFAFPVQTPQGIAISSLYPHVRPDDTCSHWQEKE